MIDAALDALAARSAPCAQLSERELLVCVSGPLHDAWEELRAASGKERVQQLGGARGFRLEDLAGISVRAEDPAPVARFLARRLPAHVRPQFTGALPENRALPESRALPERPAPSASLALREGLAPITGEPRVSLAARFRLRNGPSPLRTQYEAEPPGRVRVEAFELHVAEHCNLRCANCCNLSPLVPERFLSVDETLALCARMARVLVADVFKIMGGEPLLHPQIAAILRGVRASGIGERVRLFTNGLLLGSMRDDFWEALDELTISSYASAPVKPHVLQLARERAARHDFVLNVKDVHEFTQVISPRFHGETRATFAACWLRHRCLIVRGGRFYMCTRAAYADEFLARAEHEEARFPVDRSNDGLAIDAPDLVDALLAYLNRKEPLGACHYCYGGDGVSEPHAQLTRAEVREGVLSRSLRVLR